MVEEQIILYIKLEIMTQCFKTNELGTVQLGYSECKQTEPLFCDRRNRCISLKYLAY